MKFKIFISSVQSEFAKARSAIAEMVRKDRLLNCFFETFVFEKGAARDRKAKNVYLDAIADCDIYLVLCGDKYGNFDDKGVSPTEHEFDKATELKKLRLAFVKESSAKREKRESEFIGKIGEELTWRSFTSLASLKDAVYDALFCWLQERDIVASKPYDKSASLEVTMDDLDPAKFEAYVKMVREKKKVTFAAGMTSEDVLERLGAIDPKTRRISNAAVWLFAKEPQRWRPSWEIRCLQFWGTEVTKPLPALHTYNGTVFEQIDQALDFVMSRVDFYVGAPKKAAAPTKPEFPDDAIREAIVNAVCHRDYTDSGCVQVMLFKDRLEIINPGTLPRGWTAKDLVRSHDSRPHNELLALAMSWTSYVEKSGSGTTDIIAKCRSWGLGAPEYYPETSDFKTVIWRRGFGPDAVSTTADSNVKGLKKGLQLRPQSWP